MDASTEEQIFETARGLNNAAERRAFLDSACADNPSLRRDVEKLLAGLARSGQFFAEGHLALDQTSMVFQALEKPGDKLGSYRLIEPLGEGGCGVVYRAEQEEPIRRQVALKVIKLGMDTRSVVARFEAERQALALMDHPSIAKVFDAGATSTGRPFFVMELVRGLRITDYCSRNKLPIRDRLDLFLQVCQAVQHAHQKGIIHRDLKPSNILVAVQEGRAVPKVIDFGIARATQGKLTDYTLLTAAEQLLGTPAYMSPEQANLANEDIDTRSDIYSLGILLYELLTGKTPFDTRDLLAEGVDHMRRIIREQEPMPPSTQPIQLPLAGESPSTTRKSEIAADLDCIVMKCLEKDRARRYATANGLARDIQRHLNYEPILARPPTWGYRFQKFARRNKLLIGAGTLVFAALLLGTSVALWQASHARRAQKEAQRARADEELLRRKAEAESYTSDMNLVLQRWTEGNLKEARELLQAHVPKAGQADRRGYEWRYLSHLCRDDRLWRQQSLPREPIRTLVGSDSHAFMAACGDRGVRWLDAVTGEELRGFWDERQDATNPITNVALSTGATNLVATARASGLIELWDLRQSTVLAAFRPFPGSVVSLAISSDGAWLAAASGVGLAGGTLSMWSIAQGSASHEPALLWSTPVEVPPTVLQFSPDNESLVATAKSFRHGSLAAWKCGTGKSLPGFPEQSVGYILDLSFSPDGKWLASCGVQSPIKIWNYTNRTVAFRLEGHRAHVNSVAFSLDGHRLVSGGDDGTVRIWDLDRQTLWDMFRDPRGRPIAAVRFDATGQMVIALTEGELQFWRVEARPPASEIRTGQEFGAAAVSPNGRWLVVRGASVWTNDFSSNRMAQVWDIASKQLKFHLLYKNKQPTAPTFSPDGKLFLLGGEDAGHVVSVWETARWDHAREPLEPDHWFTNDFEAGSLAFSPDGKILATAGLSVSPEKPSGATNRLAFWEVGSWRRLHLLDSAGIGTSDKTAAATVAFSPDGRTVAVGYGDGRAALWDLKQQARIREWRLPEARGFGVVVLFSNDNRWLASFWFAGAALVLHDLTRPQEDPRVLPNAHPSGIWSAAFDPESRSLVTSGNDGFINFWHLETLKLALTLKHSDGPHVRLTFSSKGDLLTSIDSTGLLKLWPADRRSDTQ